MLSLFAKPAGQRPCRSRFQLVLESLEERTLLDASPLPALANNEPLTPNERFVHRISSALVDVPLSERVQDRLVAWLDAGRSREFVAEWILKTPAARRAEVTNSFKKLLHREPTAQELRFFSTRPGRGADQLGTIWRLVRSLEYFQTQGGGTPAGFVNALCEDLLDRQATAEEVEAWVGLMQRGTTRERLTLDLLTSTEYQEAAARRIARQASPRVDNPDLIAEALAAFRDRLPITAAKARVFGSDEYLQWLLNPPAVEGDPSPGNHIVPPNPGYPFTPGFSLYTNWNPVFPANFDLGEIEAIGASPEGTFWFAYSFGVDVFDAIAGTTITAYGDGASWVSPISDTEAWIVGPMGNNFVAKITTQGGFTQAAALPGGDAASQVAAGSDGTVWVLGQSGTVYSYASATDSWSTISNDGFTIQQISLGSAENIWAIGQQQGTNVVLSWASGTGWTVDSYFNQSNPTQIAATADGSVWAMVDGFVVQRPPGDTWALVPNQTVPGEVLQLVAADRNRSLAIVDAYPFLQVLSVGVVDRPATAFPEVTDQWQLGYDAINDAFGITATGGIRSLYDDALGDFQTWLNDLQNGNVPIPLGISNENWGAITGQIAAELNNVLAVNRLFTQLNNLNTAIGLVNGDRLNAANTLVGLTTQQQQNDTAELFIVGMFEAALDGIAAALSGGAAVAASIIASGVDSVISDLTSQPNPTPDTKLAETYAELETLLANLFLTNETNYGTAQTKILQDYGMLSAVGQAVNSGSWDWEDTEGSTLAQSASNAFDLFFYQTLMPVKWQIVYLNDYICDLYTCPTIYSPDYCTYTVVISQGQNSVLENVFYVNQIGSTTNPFSKDGIYPQQALMTAIFNLGVAESDFYNSQNGWALNIVNAT